MPRSCKLHWKSCGRLGLEINLAVGDGKKMYIIIIRLDVISINIIRSIIKFFKSLSMVSRASVAGAGGSGGAGGPGGVGGLV